ncbi:MAG: hypothetical protein KME16_15555 [Scytolyngbya sp. HA4215-MV1]|nr:hypothetical protein [Scytolyngbya sp. HA4215-MV1]
MPDREKFNSPIGHFYFLRDNRYWRRNDGLGMRLMQPCH